MTVSRDMLGDSEFQDIYWVLIGAYVLKVENMPTREGCIARTAPDSAEWQVYKICIPVKYY